MIYLSRDISFLYDATESKRTESAGKSLISGSERNRKLLDKQLDLLEKAVDESQKTIHGHNDYSPMVCAIDWMRCHGIPRIQFFTFIVKLLKEFP